MCNIGAHFLKWHSEYEINICLIYDTFNIDNEDHNLS